MFKNFPGYQLVESYQKKKKENRLSKKNFNSRVIRLLIPILVAITLWAIPTEALGIEGLTLIEQRVIAIFVLATLMWILEPIPAWTTSTVAVVLLLFTCSNSSLWLFSNGIPKETLGTPVKYISLLHCYADPIIMLFIGGFTLAIAATKTGLDSMLARVMYC